MHSVISVDPDQTAPVRQEQSNLDLHCLSKRLQISAEDKSVRLLCDMRLVSSVYILSGFSYNALTFARLKQNYKLFIK